MKSKVVYVCSECGYESAKWIGKCPGCGGWNTFAEDVVVTSKSSKKVAQSFSVPVKLSTVDTTKDPRIVCGIGELDRVLGGGIVRGSLVLVGGEPGIGKSTILLQLIKSLEQNTSFFYVSGEESEKQLKMRADRLGIRQDFYVLTETDINAAIKHAETIAPDILIIDSIQTMYNPDIASAPGTVSQVRDVTLSLMKLAKERSISVFVVGHVTKDGALAGPKVLEHMVDCVLYFEGERHQSHRILRAVKNRFGSTNEIGVFEMTGEGLREVKNPSSMMLEGRPEQTSGSTVICTLEGTRPLLAEVQSLVAPTTFPAPRRMTTGADYNRVNLLIAVLEKRVGLNLSNQDIYVNIVGGMRIDEPAADLGIICAVASAFKNKDIDPDIALIGEVGLTGELRAVNQIDKRLNEMKKLGFSKCIIPESNKRGLAPPKDLTIYYAKNVGSALQLLF
ncbi:DNA repair protein RadA [Congzhengia sp.]|uniref:DNA repair protein RadA n=1 Tax=Congzhengia sp. TaxID=2944168 RepID=UPI00307833CA